MGQIRLERPTTSLNKLPKLKSEMAHSHAPPHSDSLLFLSLPHPFTHVLHFLTCYQPMSIFKNFTSLICRPRSHYNLKFMSKDTWPLKSYHMRDHRNTIPLKKRNYKNIKKSLERTPIKFSHFVAAYEVLPTIHRHTTLAPSMLALQTQRT